MLAPTARTRCGRPPRAAGRAGPAAGSSRSRAGPWPAAWPDRRSPATGRTRRRSGTRAAARPARPASSCPVATRSSGASRSSRTRGRRRTSASQRRRSYRLVSPSRIVVRTASRRHCGPASRNMSTSRELWSAHWRSSTTSSTGWRAHSSLSHASNAAGASPRAARSGCRNAGAGAASVWAQSRAAAASGRNGMVVDSSGRQVPHRQATSSAASAQARRARLVLPTPASPVTSRPPDRPATASFTRSRTCSRSPSRPASSARSGRLSPGMPPVCHRRARRSRRSALASCRRI